MNWQPIWRIFYGAVLLSGLIAVWVAWPGSVSQKLLWLLGASAGLLAIASLFAWIWHLTGPHYSQTKTKRLGNRKPMSPDEFYETFYSQSGLPKQTVLELLQEVADSVEMRASLLRPEDRFLVEMADQDTWGLDGGLAELTFASERREKRLGVAVDLAKIQTLDDYIKTFGSLHGRRSSNGGPTSAATN